MAKAGRSEEKRTSVRSRGRPSPDAAAQIDREILNAAREVFFQLGYERTSMAMIVKAAGVSKTTLYARYATKAELFAASVRLTIGKIENGQLAAGKRETYDLVEGLTVFGRDAILISRSPLWTNYERMVFAEGQRFPELSDVIADRVNHGVRNVAAFIADCAERDGIPCRDPEAVATTFVMAVRGFYTASVLRGVMPTAEECVAFVGKVVKTLIAGRQDW